MLADILGSQLAPKPPVKAKKQPIKRNLPDSKQVQRMKTDTKYFEFVYKKGQLKVKILQTSVKIHKLMDKVTELMEECERMLKEYNQLEAETMEHVL